MFIRYSLSLLSLLFPQECCLGISGFKDLRNIRSYILKIRGCQQLGISNTLMYMLKEVEYWRNQHILECYNAK